MMRFVLAISTAVFVTGCMETSEPPASRGDSNKVPNPIVMVGDAAAGGSAAKEVRGYGMSVVTAFEGRAAGITRFCSGDADAMALVPGQDLTSAERKRCMALGGVWSALSTKNGGGLYVRHAFAQDYLDKRK